MTDRFEEKRERMVNRDIKRRGIVDQNVIESMLSVPRHQFVPEDIKDSAYIDRPLSIGHDQTISQPYIVALMVEGAHLKPGDKVLEIGAGSGYAAAVTSNIASEVYTVESIPALAHRAEETLNNLGYSNVHVNCSDGSKGWAEHAPYDAIIVTAAAPSIPHSLKEQVKEGGRIVIPVASGIFGEKLVCATKAVGGEFREEQLGAVCFVPLVGEEGYAPDRLWPGNVSFFVLPG